MARRRRAARKAPVLKKAARKKPGARRKLTPPGRPPRKKLPRKPPRIPIPVKRRLPAPAQWLKDHPSIAAAIRWQFRSGSSTNYYAPPAETDKVAWPAWTARQQRDLSQAYRDCRDWLAAGAPQVAMGAGGLTDTPANLHANVADDAVTVNQVVSPDYMWNLYIAHVALALALETTQRLPWSIGSYRRPALRYNLNVKNSTAPVLNLLIDQATCSARFTSDATVNITDINSPAVANVGYAAVNFPP